ncbi:MAG TPA: hypothetical protein VLE91_00120 [Candidatus Saccharimonadales bacterium]|nr:hypothetical protein [Candidatus Saccharimonadales bacterium]
MPEQTHRRLVSENWLAKRTFFFDGRIVSYVKRSETPTGPRIFFELMLETDIEHDQVAVHKVQVDNRDLQKYVLENASLNKPVSMYGRFIQIKSRGNPQRMLAITPTAMLFDQTS